jgi:nicotinamidase/pyrazinamidase
MCGEKPMARTMPIEAGDVFLVIDVQNDFCPGGLLPVPYGDDVVSPINRLANRFTHIVLTQDWHPHGHHSFASSHPGRKPYETIQAHYGAQTLWPDHCIQETHGAQLHADLQIPHADLILRKGFRPEIDSYSAFFENDRETPTGLAGYLHERGFSRVFLAGLAFDYCVRYSAEDAQRQGFTAVIIEDACRAIGVADSVEAARLSFVEHGINTIEASVIP